MKLGPNNARFACPQASRLGVWLMTVAPLGVLISVTWISPVSGQPGKTMQRKLTHPAAQGKTRTAVSKTKKAETAKQAASAQQSGSAAANPMPEERMVGVRALYATTVQLEAQARALYKSGDLVNAERVSRQAIAATPFEGNRRRLSPSLLLLQGEIYLTTGQNQQALQCLLAASQNTTGALLDLDLALAYCRLGEYDTARHFYLEHDLSQREFQGQRLASQDVPTSDDPMFLEASILVARALEYNSDYRSQALTDYAAAEQIIPYNPMLGYNYGCALMQVGRYAEAQQRLQVALARGHGPLAEQAKKEFEHARYWSNYYSKHPDQSPQAGK